jgi:hypothetical protein
VAFGLGEGGGVVEMESRNASMGVCYWMTGAGCSSSSCTDCSGSRLGFCAGEMWLCFGLD